MAVSIDSVYQKVLAFANKEQRGYITPQEFNLFANQAQMEIFEQYFYDLNQVARVPGNEYVYADPDDILEEKLQIFQHEEVLGPTIPSYVHRVYRIEFMPPTTSSTGLSSTNTPGDIFNCEILKTKDFNDVISGPPLTKPTLIRPVANIRNNTLRISDGETISNSANIFFFKQPIKVRWGYVVVNEKALYDPTYTTDFELHRSEESELVYRTLAYAGVTLQKPDLTQSAMTMETTKAQQEKI